ncbi:MAG TPA: metalloregulator ArsR/SmtB family transcription factor [Bacteroidota bacterium]
MVKYNTIDLDTLFSALSDPTRRAIVERLAEGEASVGELAEPFNMSLPAISKHLRILEEAGLLLRHKEGRVHHITLNSKPMKEAMQWIERYRQFWESRLDSLETYFTKSKNQ